MTSALCSSPITPKDTGYAAALCDDLDRIALKTHESHENIVLNTNAPLGLDLER